MPLIRSYIRDLARANVGEQDFASLKDLLVNQYINHSIRKVQQDLIALGIKVFTKEALLYAPVSPVPNDMLTIPNAIIDIKASTGTKSNATYLLGTTESVIFRLKEPGTEIWTIYLDGSASAISFTTFDIATKSITIVYNDGVSTVQQVADYMNSSNLFRNYFDEVTLSPNATPNELTVASGVGLPLTAGTGTGWVTAEEVSIEDFNRLINNSYLTPTASQIIYKRSGNILGAQIIEFLPDTVKYGYLYYHYKLADLTADSDVSPIPEEYEELLIIDVCIKCYSRLKYSEGVREKAMEYENKIQGAKNNYKELMESKIIDKTRLLSDKPKD